MRPRLFVYGTLRSQFANRYARALARAALLLGPACVPGALYRLKHYPAMRRSLVPGQYVRGELYELLRPAATLAMLDGYEGRNFARIAAEARLDTGALLTAWVYEWRRPLPRWRRIESGDYLRGMPAPSSLKVERV